MVRQNDLNAIIAFGQGQNTVVRPPGYLQEDNIPVLKVKWFLLYV